MSAPVWTIRITKDPASPGLIATCTDAFGWVMTFNPQPQQTPDGIVYVGHDVKHDVPRALQIPAIDGEGP